MLAQWTAVQELYSKRNSQQGYDIRTLVCASNFVYRLPWKRSDNQQQPLRGSISAFEGRSHEKTAQYEELFFRQNNALCHRLMETEAKIHELPPPLWYSPDLAPRSFYLLVDFKKILIVKRFVPKIPETESLLEAKGKSFCKKGIETLENHWNDWIAL